MAITGTLQEQAKQKGISERALLMDAIEGAPDWETVCTRLNGISRQGVIQAIDRNGLKVRRVSRFTVSIPDAAVGELVEEGAS